MKSKMLFILAFILFGISWGLALFDTIPYKVSEERSGILNFNNSRSVELVVKGNNFTISNELLSLSKNFTVTIISEKEITVTITVENFTQKYQINAMQKSNFTYKSEPVYFEFFGQEPTTIHYRATLEGLRNRDPMLSIVSLLILLIGLTFGRLALRKRNEDV
ncbi:MAG: hypothetical protein ACP5LN_08585 [Thermoproteota archaeon]